MGQVQADLFGFDDITTDEYGRQVLPEWLEAKVKAARPVSGLAVVSEHYPMEGKWSDNHIVFEIGDGEYRAVKLDPEFSVLLLLALSKRAHPGLVVSMAETLNLDDRVEVFGMEIPNDSGDIEGI